MGSAEWQLASRERFLASSRRSLSFSLGTHDLVVTLSVAEARVRFRPVASNADLRRVQKTLRQDGQAGEESWAKRVKQAAKLVGGDLLELVEIVRDGMRRETHAKEGAAPKVSDSERRLYLQARELLAGEISTARGLEQVEADAWIDEQLTLA
jgi:RNA polymerase-interacting CarD/CdnL/TRCF family regulator